LIIKPKGDAMTEYQFARVLTPEGCVVEGKVVKETKSGTGTGALLGAVVGAALGDPTGILLGAGIGGALGSDTKASATIIDKSGNEVSGQVVENSRRTLRTES
jgi:uncharacterized membrane protein